LGELCRPGVSRPRLALCATGSTGFTALTGSRRAGPLLPSDHDCRAREHLRKRPKEAGLTQLRITGTVPLNSPSQYIESVRRAAGRMQLDGLHRKNGEFRRQRRIPKWRATTDEDRQYYFAVAL
jgi:hypothetical protein